MSDVNVSVLLSTCNRARLLEQTLKALALLDCDDLVWQLIVVDNGSVDETRQVLDGAPRALPLRVLVEPTPGKNVALNRALGVATGALIVFTDDDVIPGRRWLAELWGAARRWPDCSIFGGPITPRFEVEPPEWLRNHSFAPRAFARFEFDQPEGPLKVGVRPFGPNYAIRRDVLDGQRFSEMIGPRGSDYAMGSEVELIQRLFDRGERAIYVPSAPVEHVIEAHQITLPWLLGRAFRAGRGIVRLRWTAGAPLAVVEPGQSLWRRRLGLWVRYHLSAFRGPQARLAAGLRLYRLRGMIHESRLLAAEGRSAPTPGMARSDTPLHGHLEEPARNDDV